ncbi:MAG: SDR family NAD(P)-dependent oxidoreductase [Janthinobacterium lividum]
MRALITGAASGIGRAVAFNLTEHGWESERPALLLVDRDAGRLEAVADELRALGATAIAAVADLSDPGAPARLVAIAKEELGGLDAVVSNAGIIGGGPLLDLTVADYDRQFAVNTRPLWLLGKAAHPLLAQSHGSIVATASMSAEHPTPGLAAYSASKAAAIMLIRQMAIEWGPAGIRCNCVSPGPTLTPMTSAGYADPERLRHRQSTIPLGRIGLPEDIARAIAFLLGPQSGFITGVNLAVDGGMSQMLMPASGGGTGQKASG